MSLPTGSSDRSTAATQTTAPVAGVSGGLYTFATPMRKVKIQSKYAASGNLLVRWNAGEIANVGTDASKWDDELSPGDWALFPGQRGEATVSSVGIWLTAADTYGEDFVIQGWP